ncbi:MAG: NlpC/P60 family protein [Xanthobacteraceae bacterium]
MTAAPASAELTRQRIVETARGWVGTPYRHQGSLKGAGADCLGLVRGVWRDLYGAEPEPIVPYSPNWAEESRAETLRDAAGRHMPSVGDGLAGERLLALVRPGDLILIRVRERGPAKHAAILSKPGFIVHAYDRHAVMESALPEAWRRKVAFAFVFPGILDVRAPDTRPPAARSSARGVD